MKQYCSGNRLNGGKSVLSKRKTSHHVAETSVHRMFYNSNRSLSLRLCERSKRFRRVLSIDFASLGFPGGISYYCGFSSS